jgi:hypothetical protein
MAYCYEIKETHFYKAHNKLRSLKPSTIDPSQVNNEYFTIAKSPEIRCLTGKPFRNMKLAATPPPLILTNLLTKLLKRSHKLG